MGLIIKPKNENKIIISGTSIELLEVYARLEFAGRADGRKLEIVISIFASKQAFQSGAGVLATNIKTKNTLVEILETEKQSIITAHKYAKIAIEDLGYEVISEENLNE